MTFNHQTNKFFGILILVCSLSCKNEKPVAISKSAEPDVATQTIPKRLFYDSFPKPAGYINDYEGVFTDSEKITLASIISTFEKETGVEIAIATFDSSMTTANNLEALTFKLANKWAIGKKNKDNGIVIGLSKHFRKMRIENGKGISAILSDTETKTIIDEDFLPYYKQGNYFEGTKKGLLSLMQKLRNKYTA